MHRDTSSWRYRLATHKELIDKNNKWNRICPSCGRGRSTDDADHHSRGEWSWHPYLYLNDKNNWVPVDDKECGRCGHEIHCGYHLTPRQWFAMHKDVRLQFATDESLQHRQEEQQAWVRAHPAFDYGRAVQEDPLIESYFDFMEGVYRKTCDYHRSPLYRHLAALFGPERTDAAYERLDITATADGRTIFWQRDNHGRIHTGKIVRYLANGKRDKSAGGVNWVNNDRSLPNLSRPDNLPQCLFGNLQNLPSSPILLVEGEKAALYGTILYPDYTWLATGSKQNLTAEMLEPITTRPIVLLPDVDALDDWATKADTLRDRGLDITIPFRWIDLCHSPSHRNTNHDLEDFYLDSG